MLAAHEHGSGILDRTAPIAALDALAVLPGAFDAEGHLRAALAAALADRYMLDRELGRGGMATVFLAHERKHERRVVLKVLDPTLAAIYGAERFAREVRIAARLSHPHIVPLLDSGEAAGLLFYVMPYLEGETLRDRLAARGPLPFSEAMTLLRDIAEGLEHAHEAGVVHRDLKPENVLCSGEHAYLLDFGIAKLVHPTSVSGSLTREGVVVGTPAYMAPEQRHGDPEADHRVDVYAWGLLAHEMLTGRLPATVVVGTEPHAVARAGARSDTLVPVLPQPVARLVARCLAEDPGDRPQGMSEVLEELRALATPVASGSDRSAWLGMRRPRALMAGLVGVGLLGALWMLQPEDGSEGPAVMLASGIGAPLAVAPLSNQTGDPALDSWGRMAADWITQGLQEVAVAPVVPWASSLGAVTRAGSSGSDVVRLLQEETGAGAVVTGRYYLGGDSLHVRVEIVDAVSGRVLAAPAPVSVPRDSTSAATRLLRDRVMSAVAIVADDRLATVPGLEGHPPSFEAYRAFDDGMRRFLDQDYAGAEPFFREAYAHDSSFHVALIYAATAAWNVGAVATADSLVNRLLAGDVPLNGYHRAWTESMAALIGGDRAAAREAARRAALAAPASRAAYMFASLALDTDRPREAIEMLDQLDPDRGDMRGWSSYWTERAHALHLLGRYEEEVLAARALRARFPQRQVSWVLEARALGALGRTAAIDSLVAAARDSMEADTYWSPGAVLVLAGEALLAHHGPGEAERFLEEAIIWLERRLQVVPDDRAHRYWLGSAAVGLGRWEDAARIFAGLARDYPARLRYRGLAAVSAAHARTGDPRTLLGRPRPHERGEHAAWRGWVAAVQGDQDAAAAAFAEAARLGHEGLPWMHEIAGRDLRSLWDAGVPLPLALSRPAPAAPALVR